MISHACLSQVLKTPSNIIPRLLCQTLMDEDGNEPGGIRKFTDEVGQLWTSLADYYIRRGLFEKARDVFEEGMTTVVTVRDFSVVFDAYSRFEESTLAAYDLRDSYKKFKKAGAEVVGISGDDPSPHKESVCTCFCKGVVKVMSVTKAVMSTNSTDGMLGKTHVGGHGKETDPVRVELFCAARNIKMAMTVMFLRSPTFISAFSFLGGFDTPEEFGLSAPIPEVTPQPYPLPPGATLMSMKRKYSDMDLEMSISEEIEFDAFFSYNKTMTRNCPRHLVSSNAKEGLHNLYAPLWKSGIGKPLLVVD
ncbi:hypothetical protein IFM89_014620 [Coptis chinensis]|uniref:Pre-mRNA-splicing factor SYF1 central HAT repeats domain-containing protein n=1 Tax=Coptis chinensis TaxID=261450 RepID=A0A835M688_9MAGN|nr:hypothetical protein IFM89_014620 [Coptis chinensis]